jgi:hypothetical protein
VDIRTVSRTAGAIALVGAALVNAIPIEVSSNEDGPAVDQLRDYANNAGTAQVSNVLLLGAILLVPAMIYAARLARRGAPKLAFFGGGLAALGWLAGLISIGGMGLALYEGSKVSDRAGAAALIEGINTDPVYGTLVLTFVAGHAVGMILLGVALWRSRAVPTWAAALFIAAPVLHVIGHATNPLVDRASGVAFLVSALAVAVQIMRTPDDVWDAPAARFRSPVAVPQTQP